MAKQTLEVMASETLSVVDEKIVMLKMVIARLTNSPTALLSSEYLVTSAIIAPGRPRGGASLSIASRKQMGEVLLEDFREKWDVASAMRTRWTDFDKPTYDAYIRAIKVLQGGCSLWAVEEYWRIGNRQ